MSGLDANGRVDRALRLLAPALQPTIERELRRVYRANWQQNLSVAHGSDTSQPLDVYAALKTMIDNWQSCFKDKFKAKTRTDVSKALDGRNSVSHTSSEIPAADAQLGCYRYGRAWLSCSLIKFPGLKNIYQ